MLAGHSWALGNPTVRITRKLTRPDWGEKELPTILSRVKLEEQGLLISPSYILQLSYGQVFPTFTHTVRHDVNGH